MEAFQKKRLRFLAIWMAVFAAVFAWWLYQGVLDDSPAARTLIWLNMPSLSAMIVSGNIHQPSFIGWAVAYFAQWTVVGYLVARAIYRKSPQASS